MDGFSGKNILWILVYCGLAVATVFADNWLEPMFLEFFDGGGPDWLVDYGDYLTSPQVMIAPVLLAIIVLTGQLLRSGLLSFPGMFQIGFLVLYLPLALSHSIWFLINGELYLEQEGLIGFLSALAGSFIVVVIFHGVILNQMRALPAFVAVPVATLLATAFYLFEGQFATGLSAGRESLEFQWPSTMSLFGLAIVHLFYASLVRANRSTILPILAMTTVTVVTLSGVMAQLEHGEPIGTPVWMDWAALFAPFLGITAFIMVVQKEIRAAM